ncbi:hypothetical protein KC19_VG257800 [Ceratodon purpureus]|uniref:Uncharacterized protein n=1 Tax=Ceratodon purpureus TaxID=3225 RepID=A0A8T0HV84_CERPU|nr:hypothetical protein KC19_VG257800 [Ceratodon purpureus]
MRAKHGSAPAVDVEGNLGGGVQGGTAQPGGLGEFFEVAEQLLSTAGTRQEGEPSTEEVLQVPARRGQLEEHLRPGDFLDLGASIAEPLPDKLVMDDLTDMSLEGNTIHKVSVNVINMVWGGELILNPCQRVFGTVVGMLSDDMDGVLFDEDFGDFFGVQTIRMEDCQPWMPAKATAKDNCGIEGLLRKAVPTPCCATDLAVCNTSHLLQVPTPRAHAVTGEGSGT